MSLQVIAIIDSGGADNTVVYHGRVDTTSIGCGGGANTIIGHGGILA